MIYFRYVQSLSRFYRLTHESNRQVIEELPPESGRAIGKKIEKSACTMPGYRWTPGE
ncbi:MAG: hypothetical protein GY940_30465 [bacterium]|nr:hypothetical protein [bacterium]